MPDRCACLLSFAPTVECLLFWFAYLAPTPPHTKTDLRDLAVIVAANLASFLLGMLIPAEVFSFGVQFFY